jgi:hypothetical protein
MKIGSFAHALHTVSTNNGALTSFARMSLVGRFVSAALGGGGQAGLSELEDVTPDQPGLTYLSDPALHEPLTLEQWRACLTTVGELMASKRFEHCWSHLRQVATLEAGTDLVPALEVLERGLSADGWQDARDIGMAKLADWLWGKELFAYVRGLRARSESLCWQRPLMFIPGLRTQAFWAVEEFDWFPAFQESLPDVKEELRKVSEHHRHEFLPYNPTESNMRGDEDAFFRRLESDAISDWNGFYLSTPYQRGLRSLFSDLCPNTFALISRIPGINWDEQLLFSALAPRGQIPPHYGSHNGMIRVHAMLRGDGPVYVSVGCETRHYHENDVYAFDDSFLHGVRNSGSETRVNLMLAIMHPEVPAAMVPERPDAHEQPQPWEAEARAKLSAANWWR